MNILNTFIIPCGTFLVLDGAYWILFKNYLYKTFGKSDSVYESGSMKNTGFIINMLIELFALVYFLILTMSSVLNAFIFGLVLQGYSSSINYAIVKDWNLNHSLMCTLWKGILFALTIYITHILV
jgi:uncharacterized membrane protein